MKTTIHNELNTPHLRAPNPGHACALSGLCGLNIDNGRCPPALDRAAKHSRNLAKGEFLYRVGDPFRAIFLIQSGCVKTSLLSHGGGIQVLRFALPGELLGVNAIATGRHPSDAVALDATQLCELSFAELETLAAAHPEVQHRLLHLLSDEIARDEKLMAMLGHQKAEVRLAHCLLDFHARCQRPVHAGTPFRLPMSRQDIADYLGLSLETVSRLLSRFQKSGLLRVQGRQLRLLDIAQLRAIGSAGILSPARTA